MKTHIVRILPFVAISTFLSSPMAHAAPLDSDGDGLSDALELFYTTDPIDPDSDDDGLSDGDEIFIYHTVPVKADTDDDQLSDGQEVLINHTNPRLVDTDGDGLNDGEEIILYASDPTKTDTDNDGLNDGEEVNTYKSNPADSDTDGDGIRDSVEVNVYQTDPIKLDSDGDGLNDGMEIYLYHSNPNLVDTDQDGLIDGAEANAYHSNPTKTDTDGDGINDKLDPDTYHPLHQDTDTDWDGVVDRLEISDYHTDPRKLDTDGDGINDGMEVYIYLTDPNLVDSDHDGLNDWEEVNVYFTKPRVADTDGDGTNDKDDPDTYLSPLLGLDSDQDGLVDGLEIFIYHTDELAADTDGDGLSDEAEVHTYHTNPLLTDTDGDGSSDGMEVNITHTNPLVFDTNGETDSDTDGDGLSNDYETNTTHTDPLVADTDNDGVDDGLEVNLLHTDPTRSFNMHTGTSTIPFSSALVNGSYEGLVYDPASGVSFRQKITLSSNGTFSATLAGLPKNSMKQPMDASYKGTFTNLGEATKLVNVGTLVSVQMNVEKQGTGDYYIHGLFTTNTNSQLYFELHRSNYSKKNPYPNPGKVTFAASLDTDADGPEGHAVATGEIRSDGTVIFKTYLPDGGSSSYTGSIVTGDIINLYTRSNSKSRTTLVGALVIRDVPSTSDFDGTVRLFSNIESPGGLFPYGFDQIRNLAGSFYTPPFFVGTLPLSNFTLTTNNALYRWIGGNFDGVDKVGTWTDDGRMVIAATSMDSAKATFATSSGLLTLDYTRSDNRRGLNNAKSKALAVVMQKNNEFKGFYTSNLSAGDFEVIPNE